MTNITVEKRKDIQSIKRLVITKHGYGIAYADETINLIDAGFRPDIQVISLMTAQTFTFNLWKVSLNPTHHMYNFKYPRVVSSESGSLRLSVRTDTIYRWDCGVINIKGLCRLIDEFMEEYIESQFERFTHGNPERRGYSYIQDLRYIRNFRHSALEHRHKHFDYRCEDGKIPNVFRRLT